MPRSSLPPRREPDRWHDHDERVNPERRKFKRVWRTNRLHGEPDRADDRDEENEPDRDDEDEDVERA